MNTEPSNTETKANESLPKFKSKAEAEAYCLKEVGISMKELNIVNQTPKAYRSAVHAFYAMMRSEGIKMDKISEVQRRDAFIRGYLYGLQEMAKAANDTAV